MNRLVAGWLLSLVVAAPLPAQAGGTLRYCLRAEPKTFHPLQASDESSEILRYLTSGVLIRTNRVTQQPEGQLAESWKISEGGRRIAFQLRRNVRFSDGTPFTAEDVAYTIGLLVSPDLRSPVGEAFRLPEGNAVARVHSPHSVSIVFPAPVAGLERLFDGVSILSRQSALKEKAVLGPFRLREYKAGAYVELERNPNFWRTDQHGRRLPYLDGVRIDIQQNREIELLRFRRGELHLITKLEPEVYERLAAEAPQAVINAGPSLESEQMWFNQVAAAPIPVHKKAWFASKNFRNAISHAIRREDLARVAFLSLAEPAAGPVSPASRFWHYAGLKPRRYDSSGALALLARDGFRKQRDRLLDRHGNPVEFSLITNAGNKTRARMAALIQQDLGEIGIELRVVALDFPSLIERITRTFQYEACLLGMVNVDLDPMGQMNVWLSSAAAHQWNPSQKSPATPWEAEIDELMRKQATTLNATTRKLHFDRVQQIVHDQEPFLYLVYKNVLSAASPLVGNLRPTVLFPYLYWNMEELQLAPGQGGQGK